MSAIINGVSSNGVPTGLTVPSDGDGPGIKAADVVAPLQGLLDGEANLNTRVTSLTTRADANDVAVGQLRYLNWPYAYALGSFTGAFATWDAYNAKAWVGGVLAGQPSLMMVSEPVGASSDFISGQGAAEVPTDLAADNLGNVVLATNTRYVFVANVAGGSKVDAFGSAVTVANAAVCYDGNHSKWIWVCNNSTTNTQVRTSTNRTTWAAGASPSGWPGLSLYRAACRNDTGVSMVVGLSGTTIYTATSTDGWSTCAVQANNTTAITSATNLYLSWDPTAADWYMVISKPTTSEVWRSTNNGVSWTLTKTFTTANLGQIAADPFGALIAPALGSQGRYYGLAISRDAGATWAMLGVSTFPATGGAGGQALFTGSQFIACVRGSASLPLIFGLRTGTPTLTALP